jgi:hypothetical protein
MTDELVNKILLVTCLKKSKKPIANPNILTHKNAVNLSRIKIKDRISDIQDIELFLVTCT